MEHIDRPCLRVLETFPQQVGEQRGLLFDDPEGLIEGQVFVPEGLLPILSHFSGEESCAEIAAALSEQFDQEVPSSVVESVAEDLAEKLCLEGPAVETARAARQEAFDQSTARPATHAGSAGYPAETEDCRASLREILDGRPRDPRELAGIVAPHIDLERGRAGYREAYGALGADRAELFVVFGTGHHAPEQALVPCTKDFELPIGSLRCDRSLAEGLFDHPATRAARPAEILHLREHSLEFQALFLRQLSESPETRLLPILTGHVDGDVPTDEALAAQLAWLAEELQRVSAERRVCLIAGADLAHQGPFFGDPLPVSDEDLEKLEAADRRTLALYQKGDLHAFYRDVMQDENPRRICGALPMYCALELARLIHGEVHAELLHYGQARAEDHAQVVSFASMLLLR